MKIQLQRFFNRSPGLRDALEQLLPTLSRMDTVPEFASIPTLRPPDGNMNAPDFIQEVQKLKGDVLFTLFGMTILSPEFLASVPQCINYHNGDLPAYRGSFATHWSLYEKAETTGYCFHRVDEGIDTGPVLLSNRFPVLPECSVTEHNAQKITDAAKRIPELMEMLLNQSPGTPQPEKAPVYTFKMTHAVRQIPNPNALNHDELLHRLWAMGVLHLTLRGHILPVTGLAKTDHKKGRWIFQTQDGVSVRITQLSRMPPAVWYLIDRLKSLRSLSKRF